MSGHCLIVLKFGGSVLSDESTLRLAVHEIYRWRRSGWRVIAVVSALAGRTDELLRAAQRTCADADGHAVAALVATGELQSAGLLGLHLDRAGIAAGVIWPTSCGLIAEGSPLDAEPVSLNASVLRAALARHGVVVLPGYAAHDREGRPVVLGRGGSDLTALFVSHALGARECRLIKDVDGLYDRDPILPRARRYASATLDDALATDGSIIQHKAVRFAQRHGLRFELGRINGRRPTVIGAPPRRFAPPERPRRLKVALLGLGTVGGGVYELLQQMPEQFEVTAVAVRDPVRPRPELEDPSGNPAPELTGNAVAAATSGADVVVEAIGGCEVALRAVSAALEAGADVVTANKCLVAAHGRALRALARRQCRGLRYSAAVGGSMPLLERLRALVAPRTGPRARVNTQCDGAPIRSIRGIINGTTNFVLDSISKGLTFDAALHVAQRNGFAEADPTRDLAGLDAADKLCVMVQHLGLPPLHAEEVRRDVLTASNIASALAARSASGGPMRHVASLAVDNRGRVSAEVRLLQVGEADPLARARGAGNVAVIETVDGRREVIEGRGAGRWPTAEAVVADLLAIARAAGQSGAGRACAGGRTIAARRRAARRVAAPAGAVFD